MADLQGRRWLSICALLLLAPTRLFAAPVAAHNLEGTLHGYLEVRSSDGKELAVGDLINEVHGARVTAHMIFHFKDGSVDDETSVFTQRGTFRLISDHHLQKGPFFAHPMEIWVDALNGQVAVRTWDKSGKESVHKQQMDLPQDLCSPAMLTPIARNLARGASGAEVSMLVATPKPMLVKLVYSAQGEDSFTVGGFERKAEHYEIKFELQGVAGVVAPLIGKQPPNVKIWIEEGAVPAFVKEVGPLAQDGPVVSIQQIGPVGPR
jgi:hypothetical protein